MEAQPINDPMVKLVEIAMTSLEALSSGKFLVDLIPACDDLLLRSFIYFTHIFNSEICSKMAPRRRFQVKSRKVGIRYETKLRFAIQ